MASQEHKPIPSMIPIDNDTQAMGVHAKSIAYDGMDMDKHTGSHETDPDKPVI